MNSAPYLSFVVAARNDNYGGDFLHRLQVSLDTLAQFCSCCALDAELVIVEWNPPAGNKPLIDAVRWSYPTLAVRIVTVPEEVHGTLENAERMPMFEYIAKNVGIRRARGRFVLVSNPDILFSRELIEFLAARKLRDTCFYRADRHDVDQPVPPGLSAADAQTFCARKAMRVQPLGGTVAAKTYRKKARSTVLDEEGSLVYGLEGLHTNASGDFLLMPREQWFRVRGYPELRTHSHIDSYLCAIAAASGLCQVQLQSPYGIYHQEHDRSQHATRPMTDLGTLDQTCREMLSSHSPRIDNGEGWGLAGHDLPESLVSARHLVPPPPVQRGLLPGIVERLGRLMGCKTK